MLGEASLAWGSALPARPPRASRPACTLAWVFMDSGMNFLWAASTGTSSLAGVQVSAGDKAATLLENLTSDGLCCFTLLLLFSLRRRMLQQGATRRGTESWGSDQIWSLR